MCFGIQRNGFASYKFLCEAKKKLEKEETINICILCEKTCSENKSNFLVESWKNLKTAAEEWKGLDTYGNIRFRKC